MRSRSPRKARCKGRGEVLRCLANSATSAPSRETARLKGSGASSTMALGQLLRPLSACRYGRQPHSNSYCSTPRAYTSVAVVMGCANTCSGAAYSRVIGRAWVAVSCAPPRASSSSNLAMPKSSNFGAPAGVTKILEGFKSRCTMRLRCAYCTASHTFSSRRTRAGRSSACASHQCVMASPSINSRVKYGVPFSLTPPSSSGAMCT